MTLIMIITAAAFTLLMLYQMVTPFLKTRRDQLHFELLDHDLRRVEELAAQKTTLLKSLREVEFDHDTGKLTDEDYKELKTRYERQALKVMRAIDELHGGRGWEQAIDEQLERRIEVLRLESEVQDKAALTSAILARDAASQRTQCAECGHQLDADARFCSRCGTTVHAAAAGADAPSATPLAHPGPKVTT